MILDHPLETELIRLRTLEPEDVTETYVEWLNDPKINRFLEVRLKRQTFESTQDFVIAMQESAVNILFGMFLKVDNRHVGNIKLGPIDYHHGRAEIGLVIGEQSVWGQGIGSQAIRAVAEYAFGDLNLYKVCAGYYADNIGSGRAFARAGFHVEARFPEHWLLDGNRHDEVIVSRFRDIHP